MDDWFSIQAPKLKVNGANHPKNAERLADDVIDQGIQVVTLESPLAYRRAVYKMASFFRREFGYDFVQYGHEGEEDDPKARAFLWFDFDSDFVIGSCCFRWREWIDHPASWALQWIWFHPYCRGHGLLTKAWPVFKNHFGEFAVEPPLSSGMRGFLKSVNGKNDKIVSE